MDHCKVSVHICCMFVFNVSMHVCVQPSSAANIERMTLCDQGHEYLIDF